MLNPLGTDLFFERKVNGIVRNSSNLEVMNSIPVAPVLICEGSVNKLSNKYRKQKYNELISKYPWTVQFLFL